MKSTSPFGSNSIIITRKIRLNIDVPNGDKENFLKYYKRLSDWQRIAYKASNIIATHLYCQEKIKDFSYFKGETINLVDKRRGENGVLSTSRENCTYRLIAGKYKSELPTAIITCLNRNIYKSFNKEKSEYFSGKRSLRNYKENLPVPFQSKSIYNLKYNEKTKNFHFSLFKRDDLRVPLRTYLGKDLSNNKLILERIIGGEYKVCGSSYVIDNKKVFIFLTLKLPRNRQIVNRNLAAEASLSYFAPIIMVYKGNETILDKHNAFVYKRKAIQNGLKRMQESLKYNTGGKGRKQKLSGIEQFKLKEKNLVNRYTHQITSEMVQFCLKRNIGTLKLLQAQRLMSEAKEEKLILRNWSYGNILEKLKYKCDQNNIVLEY